MNTIAKWISIGLIAFETVFSVSALCLSAKPVNIVVGAERTELVSEILKGKRVGLVVNQTSIVGRERRHLLDVLLSVGIDVRCVFAPEHGFRGSTAAGEAVADSIDSKTGLPIISLFGKTRKPSAEQLKNLDAVVFDIQDVGARFYTYISTMHYVMEACADNGKEFVVLDRPNPNDYVDGPMRREGFSSFVGLDPIPLLHGLTVGELARMINGEHWLKSNPDTCCLIVIPVTGWKHGMLYSLPVRPSPNLPNQQAIRLYPSLCLFEATQFSVGRGTDFPFQVVGFPDKRYGLFTFTPKAKKGFDLHPLQQDQLCYGEDYRTLSFKGGFSLQFFFRFYQRAGKDKALLISRPQWFDLLSGSKELRYQIVKGLSEKQIRASWQPDLKKYKIMRKRYLLYSE